MSDKIEFRKVREFGEIINDTFFFLKQNLKPLLKAFVYLCGFFVLAGMISMIMQQVMFKNVVFNRSVYSGYSEKFIARLILNYLLIMIFSILNYTAIVVTVLSFIALYIEKGNVAPDVEEVWAYFKYYFFRVLSGVVLVSIFMLIGFVCCIVPGIYFFPAMSLFLPAMIFENASAGYCFGRGFKLLKDQWWITAGTLLIIWLITYTGTMFASLPGMILGFISAFTQGKTQISTTAIVITTIIQCLCQVLLILPLICASFCYFNLRERQESTGLLERIDQLGSAKEGFDTSPEEY